MSNQAKHRQVDKLKPLKIIILIVAIVVVLAAGAYLGVGLGYFRTHFLPRTTVDSVPVGTQSADHALDTVEHGIGAYQLEVKGAAGLDFTIQASQISLRYDNPAGFDQALAAQDLWQWPLALLGISHPQIADGKVSYDQTGLNQLVSGMDFMNPQKMVAPADATVAFDAASGQYVIKPEQYGTALDADQTLSLIDQAVSQSQTSLDLASAGVYQLPQIHADDPSLLSRISLFNKYVPFSVTYQLGDKQVVLDGNTTINWVNTNKKPKHQILNQVELRDWVAAFAKKYDTVGAKRTFTNAKGKSQTVSGGTYGYKLNQAKEVKAINSAYKKHSGVVRAPYWTRKAANYNADGGADWGDTYVEVDISAQHLWYFVDGQVKLQTDVDTGLPAAGRATPTGVYYVYYKQSPATLTGRMVNGKPLYVSQVQYWMPFTDDGCGLHDASWQPVFGGDWYLSNGSHGCVNMPPAKAKQLYGIIKTGCPVIVHK
ncbi:MAG: L,D-transpeptidase/peptidoglycan binding protein [Coriobacteriales bacterium]|jgi:hypothetical protein|nr:L,D-transpeptidase/peptidoglycan binding protein [Coriobacteriales bacterium]